MDWLKRKLAGHAFEGPLTAALPSILGAVASSLVSKMFSSDDKEDKAPAAAAAEPVMPEADDEAARLARRQAIYQRLSRSQGGRASTVMTDEAESDTLG